MPVTSRLARFGVFELDLNIGELSKNGRKLKLQEQPSRILSLLLEHPGQTITRDRLKESLWPSDTFVDFDHSLNAAIAKLRQALGDSAENPRFIETLARRGYRFIAPVEIVGNGESRAATAQAPATAPALGPSTPSSKTKTPLGWGVAIAVAALAAVASFATWFWHRPAPSQNTLVQLTNDPGLTMDPAVSPDGKLLAYASDRGDGRNLNIWMEQLVPEGNAVQLTHEEADTRQPSFSPDGSRIVFRSGGQGGGIFVIPSIGGEVTRLAPVGRDPHFSPDGRWIAYWTGAIATSIVTGSGRGELYVIPSEGGQPRHIGVDLAGVMDPVWSPDSNHLLVFVPPVPPDILNSRDWWLVSLEGERSQPTGIAGALQLQGFSFGFDRLPHVSQWTGGFLLFSAPHGDAINIWRMPVSRTGRSTGHAERLSSGTTLEVSPVLTPGGDLIFASLNLTSAIWSLPVNADRGQVSGELKRITDGPLQAMPSISLDGQRLAFSADSRASLPKRSSKLQVRARDLFTGREIVVAASEHSLNDRAFMHPVISRDGTLVAYNTNQALDIYAARLIDPSSHMLVHEAKGFAWDWSLDNRRLLFNSGRDEAIHEVDVSSGRQSIFLSKTGYELYQSKFSPDSRGVSLIGCDSHSVRCRVFVVPLNLDGTPQADHWIAIDHPSLWDDKPRWSPDGDLLYFVSDRDGHLCLWAQRLNGSTKQPIGTPFPVYHFHNSRLAMINVGVGPLEIDVARDKIVMGLGELTGNIWSLKQ